MRCKRCGKDNPAEVHTCTPLAIWLADALDSEFTTGRISNDTGRKAAAELRRLHAVNEELLAVLTMVGSVNAVEFLSLQPAIRDTCAAIAKAGETK